MASSCPCVWCWTLWCCPKRCSGLRDAEVNIAKSFPGRVNPQALWLWNDVCFIFPPLQSPIRSWPWALQTDGGRCGQALDSWPCQGCCAQGRNSVRNVPVAFPGCRWQVEVRKTCKVKFFCNLASPDRLSSLKGVYGYSAWPSVSCSHLHLQSPTAQTFVQFCFHCSNFVHLPTLPTDCPACKDFLQSSQPKNWEVNLKLITCELNPSKGSMMWIFLIRKKNP